MSERKRGRPKLPAGEAKTVRLQVLVSEKELPQLERAAGKSSVTSWAREELLRAAKTKRSIH